jgi:chromosome segregation ATPase
MPDRDFAAELHAREAEIAQAQQDLGRLQAEKAALGRTKAEIIAACKELGVEPKRDIIEAEIERVQKDLQRELAAIDTELKA